MSEVQINQPARTSSTATVYTFIYRRKAVTNADSPYDVETDYTYFGVDTTGGPVTLNLPTIANASNAYGGYKFCIVDEGGQAATNNITILPNETGTETIVGNTRTEGGVIIDGNYNSINVSNNADTGGNGKWFIV